MARHLLDHLDHYLSSCQLGITIASLILGWLAEPAIAQLLIVGVGAMGFAVSPDSALTHAVSLAIALTIVTILHMTVGEQAPKIWAIRRPEQMSLVIAYPLRVFSGMFRPFIWFINEVSNALLRLGGLKASHADESLDVMEIKEILATSAAAGQISARQVEFAANVLNLVDSLGSPRPRPRGKHGRHHRWIRRRAARHVAGRGQHDHDYRLRSDGSRRRTAPDSLAAFQAY